ncbi:DUF6266 family protein [Olivibacter sp. CPCC 100613]|uniref:DUF6266 family protein n=1 Tax=Olivibacter sp. CPCC 100613 TaxID=3079931 RepID=UPI002FF68539
MAIIKNGINGSFFGKVGSVIGYEWRGIPVMRGLPKKRTSPPSEKELANRGRMRIMQKFLQDSKNFINLGFQLEAKLRNMSAFNAAMSYNKRHAITGDYPDLKIDYEKLLVSKGILTPPADPSVIYSENKLHFKWNAALAPFSVRVLLFAFTEDRSYINASYGLVYGDSGEDLLEFELAESDYPSGIRIHSYITFINLMHDAISNSVYCGVIET